MPYDLDDTIVAIASGPGGAAEGIVRLSGPEAVTCVGRILAEEGATALVAADRPTALESAIRLPEIFAPLPCTCYVWPGGRSYTGQPVVEIHTLGSPPLLEAVVAECLAAGARSAEPGEFTLRAFLSGRIDLTQAEAVLGVIDAHDDRQLDAALAQLAGGLAQPLGRLRDTLLDLLGHLEAGLDFADEDLPLLETNQLSQRLADALADVEGLQRQLASRSRSGDLARAVLVGWPNAGKSSLFNALAGGPGALVSTQPGTTRDYLQAEIDLEGVHVELIDTAGIEPPEESLSEVAQAAQAVRADQVASADVQIVCLDGARPPNAWEQAQLAQGDVPGRLVVRTKTDLAPRPECPAWVLPTSARTGQGLAALREQLREAVLATGGAGEGVVAATSVRCHESVRQASEALRHAADLVAARGGEELVAADVRAALDALGHVAGAVYTDDLLDRIFSRFCIGK
ncbi:MAG: tRNA modification GTPase [Pirellulales bacterium]|nr:tRNA modification GTPase [Pirellulales bacterium]